MEHLKRRLRDVEATVDLDAENNTLSAVESLRLLSQQIDSFTRTSQPLTKLIKNLSSTKVKLHLDTVVDIKLEQFDKEKSVVESHMGTIVSIAKELVKLQQIIEGNTQLYHLDTKILGYEDKIQRQFEQLKKAEIKYNTLLIRSIALLQNYLKLNENVNSFYRRVEVQLT